MTLTFAVPELTDILAWVGAITGVFALVWQINTRRKSAHRVKVTRSRSMISYASGGMSAPLVCIGATNVGAGPVTVTNWGIALGASKQNLTVVRPLSVSTPLPHRLEPGADMSLFVELDDLRRAHHEKRAPYRSMRGWVGLATGEKVRARRGVPVPSDIADSR